MPLKFNLVIEWPIIRDSDSSNLLYITERNVYVTKLPFSGSLGSIQWWITNGKSSNPGNANDTNKVKNCMLELQMQNIHRKKHNRKMKIKSEKTMYSNKMIIIIIFPMVRNV